MKKLRFVVASVLLCSFHTVPTARSAAQEKQEAPGALSLYNNTLAHIFPQPTADYHTTERLIVFRILPSFQSEARVAIREGYGKVEVSYVATDKAQGNLFYYIIRLQEKKGIKDLDNVLKNIRVKSFKITTPSLDLRRHLRAFPEIRISPNLETGIVTDGTKYELWVFTKSEELHLSLSRQDPGHDVLAVPIVRWMNRTHTLLEAEASKHSQ